MDEAAGDLDIFIDGDHVLAIGGKADLESFMSTLDATGVSASAVAQGILGIAATALGVTSSTPNLGGQLFKMTDQSRKAFATNARFNLPRNGQVAGVVRRQKGMIYSHAKFTPIKGLTAAAKVNFAVLAATMALSASVEQLADFVQAMDIKLDQLRNDNRFKAMGDIQGVAQVLSKAYEQFESTGHVSQTSWDQVAGQATIVAQSRSYAENQLRQIILEIPGGSLKGRLELLDKLTGTELKTWLAILATCNVNEARLEAIEAAHAKDESAEASAAHSASILQSRKARELATSSKLRDLTSALTKAGTLSDFDRLRSPVKTSKIHELVNSCLITAKIFADIHEIEDAKIELIPLESVRKSIANIAGGVKNTATTTAKSIPVTILNASEERTLRKAAAIKDRRAQKDERLEDSSSDSPELTVDESPGQENGGPVPQDQPATATELE